MRIRILKIWMAALMCSLIMLCPLTAAAQSAADSVAGQSPVLPVGVIKNIIDSYTPWHDAEFSGKVSTDKLPLSPTVKIYMVRDSLFQLSLRAPLLGEVGRLNVTKTEVLLVNRMKKLYVKERTDGFFEGHPTLLEELQSIFLARVIVLGRGPLGADNFGDVEVAELENGNTALMPHSDLAASIFNYGYIVSPSGRTLDMLAVIKETASLEIAYSYSGGGMQMNCTFERTSKGNKRSDSAKIDFSSVKWGGREMSSLRLGGYEKVGIKDFIKRIN